MIQTNKLCGICHRELPLDQFRRKASSKDGLDYRCKACALKMDKPVYAKNKDKYLLQQRNRRRNNPEFFKNKAKVQAIKHKDRISKYQKEYRESNKERLKEQQHRYYDEHKDKVKFRIRTYSKAHPEKERVHKENRRARKDFGSYQRITYDEWIEILEKYEYTCLCCGIKSNKLTQDHVVPLSKGGTHSIDNIQPLCVSCNSRKHTDIIDYRR